jgi:hypothetical protein
MKLYGSKYPENCLPGNGSQHIAMRGLTKCILGGVNQEITNEIKIKAKTVYTQVQNRLENQETLLY